MPKLVQNLKKSIKIEFKNQRLRSTIFSKNSLILFFIRICNNNFLIK